MAGKRKDRDGFDRFTTNGLGFTNVKPAIDKKQIEAINKAPVKKGKK